MGMIISASKRTDIPAFYAGWFIEHFKAGYFPIPRAGGACSKIWLAQGVVDGFVFWTKNVAPFMEALALVAQQRYPFYVQYTVNDYPKELEPHVPSVAESVSNIKGIRTAYGVDAVVWRYDPIVITPGMPAAWHVDNFRALAKSLYGATNEVVTSFADIRIYKHVRRRMADMKWLELTTTEKTTLASNLAAIAKQYDMRFTLCCETDVQGVCPARCVDVGRLERIAGHSILGKPGPCRVGCGCVANVDIGGYNTCGHGCRYCYATNDYAAVRKALEIGAPFDVSKD